MMTFIVTLHHPGHHGVNVCGGLVTITRPDGKTITFPILRSELKDIALSAFPVEMVRVYDNSLKVHGDRMVFDSRRSDEPWVSVWEVDAE